jgi:Fe2+ or Zn2+ uptake regulation protein
VFLMSTGEDKAHVMLAELKRSGLKLTPQRIAIVRELAGDETHPTAQDLFDRLRAAFPTMSFATVYNTLDALATHGLLGALRLGGAVRFDPNTSAHHHAVCDRCHTVVDLPAEPLDAVTSRRLGRQTGFRVSVEERTYRGLCARCVDTPSA